jgi:hypothetical protein
MIRAAFSPSALSLARVDVDAAVASTALGRASGRRSSSFARDIARDAGVASTCDDAVIGAG